MRSERWTLLVAALRLAFPLSSALCLLAPLALHAEDPQPAVDISRIQVQPGSLAAQIILEAGGPLSAPKAYYLAGSPPTFVLDLNNVKTNESPVVPSSEASFIRDIQVQKLGLQDLRFLVRLDRRVPIRIRAESRRTVVEFTKVPRYLMDAETRARLDRRPKGGILLDKMDFSEAPDRVSFRAQLSGQAEVQAFSVENPWRLVVDVYDTILTVKDVLRTVDNPQIPVQKVRLAQFQMSDPRPITRLVFDLKEPGVYSVETDDRGLVVSFYKSMPAAAAEAKVTPVQEATIQTSAPKQKTPKPVPVQTPAAKDDKPLIRKDLLSFGQGEIAPPRRDIFRPRATAQPASPQSPQVVTPARKLLTPAGGPPAFALNIVYVGSARSAGKIVALVLLDGQTTPVAEGDEITPGYKVLRVTADEIEVVGPNSERKTFTRQGDRP
jgi:hypothetical protein